MKKRSATQLLIYLLLVAIGFVIVNICFHLPYVALHHSSYGQNCQELPESKESTTSRETKSRPLRLLLPSNMCKAIAGYSASGLWIDHIDEIFWASQLRRDTSFKLHDKTAEALRIVSPRLEWGQKSSSHDWKTMERIMQKAVTLSEYHSSGKNAEEAPPRIRIVVMGGSVTKGVNCFTGVSGSDISKCAWSARLEDFVNNMAGFPLVQVHNMAIAGSNSQTGQAILEHKMLPKHAQDPDIIINAYATNDMHIQSVLQAAEGNTTLRELVYDMSQGFIRAALTQSCQQRPLLLWVDDYIGNEQPDILSTTALSQMIHIMAEYYGISFVSYADVVRDLVYGDTHEGLFSPGMWYKSQNANKMQREIHPSQGMHMVTCWLVAYHFLHLASQFCAVESWNVSGFETSLDYEASTPAGLPTLKQLNLWPSKPKPLRNPSIPPPLDRHLTLEAVSDSWKQESSTRLEDCAAESRTQCPFTWISGIRPLSDIRQEVKAVNKYFHPHHKAGWVLTDDTKRGDKLGWMPNTGDSPFTLEWTSDDLNNKTARSVTVFYLKSYGEKWADSEAKLEFKAIHSTRDTTTHLQSLKLSGFHNKTTSEMYYASAELDSVDAFDTLQMTSSLTAGSTFKIMGIAICE